ncbi:hypothetical protein GCM10007108_10560 [Thermogymnomonas acidicola]|uniref:HIT domain-containing protein n=1 Tax=Thermogymnomonas acidicola TaxID=399579 RepID=A0AA37BRK0_9ARCH|nr:HIT family protein [Thermogymnomonas acidicola]GGM74507.1 hypothetical protein GCM10007108_10560 [Thermogymnomonas acidicola]
MPGRQLKLFEDETPGECVFCSIAQGKVESVTVYSDPRFVVFLDRSPLFKGHLLVIPRAHVENFDSVPPEIEGSILGVARAASLALQRVLHCDGTFIAINNKVSQTVPHLHVHVVPRRHKDGLRGFFWPRESYAEGEAERIGKEISDAMGSIMGGNGRKR